AARTISPTRLFFRTSQVVPSMAHARSVFKTLGEYGEMVEYKIMRCPETQKYLKYGFVVYKNQQGAENVTSQKFIKVNSNLFEKPCDIKIEKAN
ncbi:hypothetical protein BDB00DRAFT_742883, partial [Zychaea mexicana]|uniref:uncharacterized protein n=1 Tax=Zychaea mexicana TaxID=64656 RepID=UPI0022FDE00A